MRRIFALSVVAVMMIFMCACGSNSSGSGTTAAEQAVAEEAAETTAAEQAAAEEAAETTAAEQAVTEEVVETTTAKQKGLPEGVVLLDDDVARIEYTGAEEDFMGIELKFAIENKTDAGICIQPRDTSVNGFMVDATMSVDVAAGKKAIDDMLFFNTTLEEIGIETIEQLEEVEWTIHIFDQESWDTIEDIPVSMKAE